MLSGLRLAFATLTALPVGPPATVDRAVAGRAMAGAPVVGAVLGAAAFGVGDAFRWWTGAPVVGAVTAVATLAAVTRGLHLDGLADTADGLGSAKPAEQALRIMKASDIGPFGVITLVLALLGQVLLITAAWDRHGDAHAAATLVVAAAAGRLAVTWGCRPGVPSARPDGLGAWVAGSVAWWRVAAASGFCLALALGAGALTGPARLLGVWPAAVLAAVAVSGLLLRHAVRRFGGITGDVLGALVETGFTAALVVLAR